MVSYYTWKKKRSIRKKNMRYFNHIRYDLVDLKKYSIYFWNKSEDYLAKYFYPISKKKLQLSFYSNGFIYFWQYVKLFKYKKKWSDIYKIDIVNYGIYGKIIKKKNMLIQI